MDFAMGIAAALGLGPALVLMYLVLRKYTFPAVESPFFSDPRFFKLFVVGLFEGTVLLVIYTFFIRDPVMIVLLAVVFEMAKLVTLNLKRFAGQSDTIFYGYGLGLGLGCAFAFGLIFYFSSQADMEVMDWVMVLMMGLVYIFVQASTGTTIGEGVARKRVWEFLFQALFISVATSALMAAFYYMSDNETLMWLPLIGALALAIGYFYYMHFVKLPAIVREILRNEARRPKKEREEEY